MPSVTTSLRLALFLGLYALDLLDLYAKVFWIGPTESFSFEGAYERGFGEEALPRPVFLNDSNAAVESGAEWVRGSGWASYYDKCDELFATKPEEKFHTVKATNCELGARFDPEKQVAHELVLSSGVRADSVAWVSCRMLFIHRRPPICQENVVTRFPQRYVLTETEVDPQQVATINSQAEAELLRMLSLLSRSHPLSLVVCSQGFQSTAGPGHYSVSIVICGSPNVFESAVVGTYATSFPELHNDLTWLTVDKLNVMNFELVTRQNLRQQFSLRERDGELVVHVDSWVNFASFGHLYVILIVVDVVLLVLHVRATVETFLLFGRDLLLGCKENNGESGNDYDGRWMWLYRSLYRSNFVATLTIASSLLSWVVGFPFAIAWHNDYDGEVVAVLFIVRLWMLVLCSLNLLWSGVVWVVEARAYFIAKHTFITTLEVMAATTIVVSLKATSLFGVYTTRRGGDCQQIIDSETFVGRSAVSNAYCEELDGFATTPPNKVAAIYSPLVAVVVESWVLIAIVLSVKAAYYKYRGPQLQQDKDAVYTVDDINIDHVINQRASTTPLMARQHEKPYRRLPLEDLLRTPARAMGLVRTSFHVEDMDEFDTLYLSPHVYYEFGIFVSEAGLLLTRRGFFNALQRRLDVEKFFAPAESTASVYPSQLKRQQGGDKKNLSNRKTAFKLETLAPTGDVAPAENPSPSPPRTLLRFKATPQSMRRRKTMEDLFEGSKL